MSTVSDPGLPGDDLSGGGGLRAAFERLRRLQALSQRLTAALTVDDVTSVVVETLDPPTGAASRGLWLFDPVSNQLLLAEQVGMREEAVERFGRIDLDADLPGAVAFRERRTVQSPSSADSLSRFPSLAGTPRSSRGFIAVPLVVETTALGVLAFGSDGSLDDGDVGFLETAAGTVAQTLQRVRLADALQQRSEEIAFFAHVARAAIVAADVRDLMQRIADAVVPQLGDICIIHFTPEPGVAPQTVVAHRDLPEDLWPGGRPFPLDPAAEHGIARVLRTGQPELIEDLTPDVLTAAASRSGRPDPEIERVLAGLDLASALTAPLVSEGTVVGALQVLTRRSSEGDRRRDVTLIAGVASGIGDALASRWLTDQHRHISTTLQRAFLPPVLPSIPGLDVAAAYWAAGVASEIGGDFYDLFAIGEDRWAILIGDACGSGADAAATAAIARHTARAAARHGLGHREVLEWINQAVKHSDRNLFCTGCYATLERRAGDGGLDLTVSTGGHPLPIKVGTGAAGTLGRPGTLLGVFDGPTFSVSEHRLEPGDALVLYTDGLTDLPGPAGCTERHLEDLLAASTLASAEEHVRVLRRDLDHRVSATHRADDVAVMVILNTAPAP